MVIVGRGKSSIPYDFKNLTMKKQKQIKTIGYLPVNNKGKVMTNKVYKTSSAAKGQATRLMKAKNKPNG